MKELFINDGQIRVRIDGHTAHLWNTTAGKLIPVDPELPMDESTGSNVKGRICQGAEFEGMFGYMGKVWIDETNAWNVSSPNDDRCFTGCLPINQVVGLIRENLCGTH